MPKSARQRAATPGDDLVEQLRLSPIRNIQTVSYQEVDVSQIDVDPTNPGSDPHSRRYLRRGPSIAESYDIIGRNVYPVVVSQRGDAPGHYILVDGHGR